VTANRVSCRHGSTLPGLFAEDEVVQTLCAAIDEGLAPVISILDSLPAYFDPETTRDDLVEWLARWVGVDLDRGPVPPDRRRFIKGAVALHAMRGTSEGIALGVLLWFGTRPEVSESGGTGWSPEGEAPLPGAAGPSLLVTLRVPAPDAVDRRVLDSVVAALKPAHVPHRVVVEGGGS